MSDWRFRLGSLVVFASAIFLMGQDVERPPIIIVVPPKTKPQPPPPPATVPEPTPVPEPEVPRHFLSLPAPREYLLILPPHLTFLPKIDLRDLSESERVKQRLDDYFAEILARDRVRSGRLEQGWVDLANKIEDGWNPGFSQVRDPAITEISGGWLQGLVWRPLEEWYRNAGRGGPGEPLPQDDWSKPDATLLAVQRQILEDPGGFGNTVVALVEIRLGEGGKMSGELVEPSGHPLFDQAAMEAVEQVLQNPKDLDLPKEPARTILAMSACYTILPPIPVVGFTFDEVLGNFDLFYPFKKMVKGKVQVVAIYKLPPG